MLIFHFDILPFGYRVTERGRLLLFSCRLFDFAHSYITPLVFLSCLPFLYINSILHFYFFLSIYRNILFVLIAFFFCHAINIILNILPPCFTLQFRVMLLFRIRRRCERIDSHGRATTVFHPKR